MKVDELKDYLKMTGWCVYATEYYIRISRNGCDVAEVGLGEQYSLLIFDPTQMTDGLYRRLSKFAHTPVEERSGEKVYRVKFPQATRGRSPIYLNKNVGLYDSISVDWSPMDYIESRPSIFVFTEQEIKDIDERYFLFAEEVKK